MSKSNEEFAIGDVVSMGFNGDYYPQGTVTRISPSGKKITTSEGRTFWKKPNGSFKYAKTFTLIHGEKDERNPHF